MPQRRALRPAAVAAVAVAVVLVLMHGYLGGHVVRREVIFVDIALAQVAAFGVAIALLCDLLLRRLRLTRDVAHSVATAIGRLGGDEFTVMVEDIDSAGATITVASKISRALQDPFDIAGVEVV